MTAAEPPATPPRPRTGRIAARPALVALGVVVAGAVVAALLRGCIPARPERGAAAPTATSGTSEASGTTTSATATPASTVTAATAPGPATTPVTTVVSPVTTTAPPTTGTPVTAATPTVATPAPPTGPTGSTTTVPVPCTPDALTAALTIGRVDLAGTALVDPRCTADFASVVLRAPGTLDRFAVFELREPVWVVVNLGTSFVCQPLEIPNPDYTDIGCLHWDH